MRRTRLVLGWADVIRSRMMSHSTLSSVLYDVRMKFPYQIVMTSLHSITFTCCLKWSIFLRNDLLNIPVWVTVVDDDVGNTLQFLLQRDLREAVGESYDFIWMGYTFSTGYLWGHFKGKPTLVFLVYAVIDNFSWLTVTSTSKKGSELFSFNSNVKVRLVECISKTLKVLFIKDVDECIICVTAEDVWCMLPTLKTVLSTIPI